MITVCFAPNPPPILGFTTLIFDFDVSSAVASILLTWNGTCVDATHTSLPYASLYVYALKVSIIVC